MAVRTPFDPAHIVRCEPMCSREQVKREAEDPLRGASSVEVLKGLARRAAPPWAVPRRGRIALRRPCCAPRKSGRHTFNRGAQLFRFREADRLLYAWMMLSALTCPGSG